jgi:hypothetical protein
MLQNKNGVWSTHIGDVGDVILDFMFHLLVGALNKNGVTS